MAYNNEDTAVYFDTVTQIQVTEQTEFKANGNAQPRPDHNLEYKLGKFPSSELLKSELL